LPAYQVESKSPEVVQMTLSIKDPEADRLARKLVALTGENLTDAIVNSLRERLERCERRHRRSKVGEELARIAQRVKRLPIIDSRSPDEILGYDDHGLPH
jgi:antitoxin VapB